MFFINLNFLFITNETLKVKAIQNLQTILFLVKKKIQVNQKK